MLMRVFQSPQTSETFVLEQESGAGIWSGGGVPVGDSPCRLFLQLGAEQQVGEEEDVAELPGAFHQLHHEAIPQQLTVLQTDVT